MQVDLSNNALLALPLDAGVPALRLRQSLAPLRASARTYRCWPTSPSCPYPWACPLLFQTHSSRRHPRYHQVNQRHHPLSVPFGVASPSGTACPAYTTSPGFISQTSTIGLLSSTGWPRWIVGHACNAARLMQDRGPA